MQCSGIDKISTKILLYWKYEGIYLKSKNEITKKLIFYI